jgi:hypothetical protein
MRVLLIAAMLVALSVTARSECLGSMREVWRSHPGSHATWRLRLPGHEGEKCWFARGSTNQQAPRIQRVVDSPRGTDAAPPTDGQVNASATAGPDESQRALAPVKRAPLSILNWGAPMQLDPTWDEIFARRERRGR